MTVSVFLAVAAIAGGSAVRAADPGQSQDLYATSPAPQGWIVTVTGNAVVSPEFLGSKNYGLTAYPSISVRRAGTPESFSAPDDGIGLDLSPLDWLRCGPVVHYQGGRYLSGNPELHGLHKVPWTLQGGGFVELWPTGHIRARAEFVHGFGGRFCGLFLDRLGRAPRQVDLVGRPALLARRHQGHAHPFRCHLRGRAQ